MSVWKRATHSVASSDCRDHKMVPVEGYSCDTTSMSHCWVRNAQSTRSHLSFLFASWSFHTISENLKWAWQRCTSRYLLFLPDFPGSFLFCDKDRLPSKPACRQASGGFVFTKQKCVAGRQRSSEQVVCHSSASHLSVIQNTSRL